MTHSLYFDKAYRQSIPELTTVRPTELAAHQLDALSSVFSVPMDRMDGFRWGESLAPPAHELHGTEWYTLILKGGGSTTLYVDAHGRITHRRVAEP